MIDTWIFFSTKDAKDIEEAIDTGEAYSVIGKDELNLTVKRLSRRGHLQHCKFYRLTEVETIEEMMKGNTDV